LAHGASFVRALLYGAPVEGVSSLLAPRGGCVTARDALRASPQSCNLTAIDGVVLQISCPISDTWDGTRPRADEALWWLIVAEADVPADLLQPRNRASGSDNGSVLVVGIGIEYSAVVTDASTPGLAVEGQQYQNAGEGTSAGTSRLTRQNVDLIWLRLTYNFNFARGP
jgi:hypothetical protein